MGDSQPLLGLNTTTVLGQLPVPTGKNRALEDWSTQKYQSTFAKPTVSLATFLIYHSFLPVLLFWPSWQVPWRFRQDSLRPRKLAKRVKDGQRGMEGGKRKSHHFYSLLQQRQKDHETAHCATLTHLGSAQEWPPWKLKKTPEIPEYFTALTAIWGKHSSFWGSNILQSTLPTLASPVSWFAPIMACRQSQPEGILWQTSLIKTVFSYPTMPLKSHFLICLLAMPAGCNLGSDFSTSEISSAVNQHNDATESQAAVRHLKICSRCGRLEQRSKNGH